MLLNGRMFIASEQLPDEVVLVQDLLNLGVYIVEAGANDLLLLA